MRDIAKVKKIKSFSGSDGSMTGNLMDSTPNCILRDGE